MALCVYSEIGQHAELSGPEVELNDGDPIVENLHDHAGAQIGVNDAVVFTKSVMAANSFSEAVDRTVQRGSPAVELDESGSLGGDFNDRAGAAIKIHDPIPNADWPP